MKQWMVVALFMCLASCMPSAQSIRPWPWESADADPDAGAQQTTDAK